MCVKGRHVGRKRRCNIASVVVKNNFPLVAAGTKFSGASKTFIIRAFVLEGSGGSDVGGGVVMVLLMMMMMMMVIMMMMVVVVVNSRCEEVIK